MNPIAVIYENLVRMCAYRGAAVTSRIDAQEVASTAASQPFLGIVAERPADDIRGPATIKIFYYIAHDVGSQLDKVSQPINKQVKQYDQPRSGCAHTSCGADDQPRSGCAHTSCGADDQATTSTSSSIQNIIFVTDSDITPQASRNIGEHNARGTNVFIEHHLSKIFRICVPESALVPRHTIVGVDNKLSDDLRQMRSEMYISLYRDLPCLIASTKYTPPISRPDPMAVWLGMRPGMIIKIERKCETASGIEIAYRHTV